MTGIFGLLLIGVCLVPLVSACTVLPGSTQKPTPRIFRQGATYVDRILKGSNPADLPVQQPTAYDLSINLKTAEALSIAIHRDLADRVTTWIR
jgi:ABC-type uncharacterized transport system substrate-binding protein